jgi:hypothetical protein
MNVGDLVKYGDWYAGEPAIGIILKVDMGHHTKCLWHNGNVSWCPKRRLEIVNEN